MGNLAVLRQKCLTFVIITSGEVSEGKIHNKECFLKSTNKHCQRHVGPEGWGLPPKHKKQLFKKLKQLNICFKLQVSLSHCWSNTNIVITRSWTSTVQPSCWALTLLSLLDNITLVNQSVSKLSRGRGVAIIRVGSEENWFAKTNWDLSWATF